ncbi:MAG: hypothetical protein KDD47_09515, partial [Acidobacteria bacterium]|nr:hypothetical protein [Acidobacteriota bacterium]
WSFYSQGTRDGGGAPGEIFVSRALEFFGDGEMAQSPASPWTKGARLAELVAQRRTLLILDGLEPLQYPPGVQAGELQDPAVATLLKGLANKNPGLCVVTSRETVVDLAAYRESTAPERKLERLSVPAGSTLLESLGVHGSNADLEALVKEVHGHALTLLLLGRYLKKAHGGDVRRKDRVELQKADAKTQNGHAFRAMAAYERWLAKEGGEDGRRQLAILRLMGLFDRPASTGCIGALREEPVIEGLTEALVGLEEEDWNEAVSSLEEVGLLLPENPPLAPPFPKGGNSGPGVELSPSDGAPRAGGSASPSSAAEQAGPRDSDPDASAGRRRSPFGKGGVGGG